MMCVIPNHLDNYLDYMSNRKLYYVILQGEVSFNEVGDRKSKSSILHIQGLSRCIYTAPGYYPVTVTAL